ncbi:uncharacterized protein [Nicotiana sylvestris]|uniref:uncharacterized protein n=1 Tax=Nicotiana sylvestris TaxID=4096 RepID=UPI00388C722F
MAPFETLYGQRCRSPIGWFESGDAKLYGTDLVKDALENVKLIQERLRIAQSRQKSYADQKVRDLSFMVGEKVLLKISPMKGIMRFRKKVKLSPSKIQLDESLGYEEEQVAIVDRQVHQLKSKRIFTINGSTEGPTSRGGNLGVQGGHAE